LEWNELGRVEPQTFTMANLFRRLAQRDDPWQGMERRAHSIGDSEDLLAKLRD
jgi:DNA primase